MGYGNVFVGYHYALSSINETTKFYWVALTILVALKYALSGIKIS